MNRKDALIIGVAVVLAAILVSFLFLHSRPEKPIPVDSRRLQDQRVLREGSGPKTESPIGRSDESVESEIVTPAPANQNGTRPQDDSEGEPFAETPGEFQPPGMAEGPQVESDTLGRGDEVAQPTRSGKMETAEALEAHAIAPAQSTGEKSDTLAVRENGGPREDPIRIKRLAIALGVEDREPKGVSERVSVDHGRVYCWVHVTNGKGKRIIVRWISKGKHLWETRLSIGSNDWRTWAYITLRPAMIGPAQADILDEKGELLHTAFFEITG